MRETQKAKIPLHRDPRVRGYAFQASVVALLVWVILEIAGNTVANMESRGIVIGLKFMGEIATFNVGFVPFWDFTLGKSKFWEVFVIAIQNTIYVSFCGVIGATLLGFFIGVMRMSPNWLVAKLASAYVEMFRNVPLLLWFFFWYVAVFLPSLPKLRDSIALGDAIFINNEGLYFPRPIVDSPLGFTVLAMFVIAAIAGSVVLIRWARAKQETTGEQFPAGWAVLGILAVVPTVGFFVSGSPFHLQYPELGRFQLSGGVNLSTSFFVCWFSLTTYTAAFIAENVRGGIIAVSKGQTEAASSLGLRHGSVLRLVVIPQAMRVIIPPTISQYLNLTKNSTLAVAIAYEEIASLWMGIALNTTGQALVIIAMSIGVFWTLSFLTSFALNWYNRRVQLSER